MQPPSEKEFGVVYRRRRRSAKSPERLTGYAPALMPLIVGFLLLLAVIAVLGLRSATKLDDVASDARMRTQAYSTRISRLLNLRLKLTELNNEARIRDAAESRRELTPPFDVKLDQARERAKTALNDLGEPPPGEQDKVDWKKLTQNVTAQKP